MVHYFKQSCVNILNSLASILLTHVDVLKTSKLNVFSTEFIFFQNIFLLISVNGTAVNLVIQTRNSAIVLVYSSVLISSHQVCDFGSHFSDLYFSTFFLLHPALY